MQSFKIVLTAPETDAPEGFDSRLVGVNGYLVYTTAVVSTNLVDDLSVRAFLDDPKNEQVSIDFLAFLRKTLKPEEFHEIVYDNTKLANTLNDFYNSTIVNGQSPNELVIVSALTGTKRVDFVTTTFDKNNNRTNNKFFELTEISVDDSFYIPINITRSSKPISPDNFSQFSQDCIEDGILFTQCFVNLNKNRNAFEDIRNKSAGAVFGGELLLRRIRPDVDTIEIIDTTVVPDDTDVADNAFDDALTITITNPTGGTIVVSGDTFVFSGDTGFITGDTLSLITGGTNTVIF